MTGGQSRKASKPEPQGDNSAPAASPIPVPSEAAPDPSVVWVFGYGSLIWKPNFPYEEMVVGYVKGYARRFWQGNTDYRGVPGAPGRVVTLVQTKEESTWGIAYRVQPTNVPEVMAYLDDREKCGYTTHEVTFQPTSKSLTPFSALAYIGMETNPEFLGPAPIEAIARQVVNARGPNGCNAEYVLGLAEAMRRIAPLVKDDHLFELERKVRELMMVRPRIQMKAVFAVGLPACKCCNCADRTTSLNELSVSLKN